MQTINHKWKNFKLLWHLIHQYKSNIIIWLLAKIIISALVPFFQLLTMSRVISWLNSNVSVEYFFEQLLIWMTIIIILTSLDSFLKNKFDYFSETFRIELITPVNNQQVSLDYPLIVGEEGSQKYWDAMMLLDYRGTSLGRVFDEWSAIGTALLSASIYFSVLFKIDQLFLIWIVVALLGFILLKKRQQTLKENQKQAEFKNRRQSSYLAKIMGDNRLAKDLRLYHMQHWFMEIKELISANYYQLTRRLRHHRMIENIFMTMVLMVLSYQAYFSSIDLIINGELKVSDFILYVGMITLITSTLMNLVTQLSAFNISLTEMSAYATFMNQKSVFNHNNGAKLPTIIKEIEFRNVSFTYPGNQQPTINKLDLIVKHNESIAIVGLNGAGKTTLIKLLLGLLQADEGEILINGVSQKLYRINELYQLFAPIFQDYVAFTFTIRDAIIQGYSYDENKYKQVLADSGMDEIINKLPNGDKSHYVKEVHSDSVELSGGEMQRLKLAQALYKDAPVLVLDEPTAALDPIAESKVYESFDHFSQNKMAIFISHRLASTRFCDRIIYLEEGSIIESGNHNTLLAEGGKYASLYEMQAYYYQDEIIHKGPVDAEKQGGII